MKSFVAILVAATFLAPVAAKAEQCPEGVMSCKVVTISPEELKTLTDIIFPSAIWANRAQSTDLAKAWENKIANSPAGEPHKKADAPKPAQK